MKSAKIAAKKSPKVGRKYRKSGYADFYTCVYWGNLLDAQVKRINSTNGESCYNLLIHLGELLERVNNWIIKQSESPELDRLKAKITELKPLTE